MNPPMADDGLRTAPTAGAAPDGNIAVSTPAVVAWGSSNILSDVTFDLRHVSSTNDAFFKLRTIVLFKADAPSKTPLFLFIHPERIRSLHLDESETEGTASREEACKILGSDTTCLRFTLATSPDLIGPKVTNLTPKNKASGDVLDLIRSLAHQNDLAVYFPRSVLSKVLLVSLCKAASSGVLKSIARQADLASLYRGKGGEVMIGSETPTIAASHDVVPPHGSPPSYDELGPSPPPAPLVTPKDVTSKKRRRNSSDDVASDRLGPLDFERMCRKIVEEQKSEMLKLVEEQQNKLYDRLLVDLKPYISQELAKLETRILDQVEQRAGKQAEEQEENFGKQLDALRDEVDETISYRIEDVDDRVEDEFYGMRLRLEDFIKEEMTEAEERIVEHLESSASISLQFNS